MDGVPRTRKGEELKSYLSLGFPSATENTVVLGVRELEIYSEDGNHAQS